MPKESFCYCASRDGPTVPTNNEAIFARFMITWEKKIQARAVGIQKENWGTTHLSEN